jgi:hypothetical protein
VTCTSGEGVGANLRFSLTVGPWTVVSAPLVSYIPPNITRVGSFRQLDTQGGQQFTLHGSNFGPLGYAPTVSYTHEESGVTVSAASCSVTVAHTEVTCTTGQGAGVGFRMVLVVGGQPSTPFPVDTGYAAPSVTTVYPDVVQDTGGEVIVVNGSNFGPPGWQLRVMYGPEGRRQRYSAGRCVRVPSSPHTAVQCLSAPGVGRDLVVTVEAEGQLSVPHASAALSYGVPQVHVVRGKGADGGSTRGGDIVGQTHPALSCYSFTPPFSFTFLRTPLPF